jgi:hypothetical protein
LSRASCGTIDVVVLEFLDAGDLDRGIGLARRHQALLVRLAPGIVDEDHARLLGGVFLHCVIDERDIDQVLDLLGAGGTDPAQQDRIAERRRGVARREIEMPEPQPFVGQRQELV